MSYARGFSQNGKSIYMNITKPQEVELSFTVDAANGNGLGVRTIKSNGYVRNVFMHTSATPGVGLDGYVNPNPIAGYILIQFKNNFNYALSGSNSIVSPLSGSSVTSTTTGHAYVIVSLGTTTLAQWNAAGVPLGLTPSVGMSFIATATGSIGGTGAVQVPSFSTIDSIETVGDPNQSISNSNIAANGGAWLLLQCQTSSSGSPALATPAAGTVIALRCRFDGSIVSIPDGGPSNTGTGGL
jgi:hypothetical protein